MATEFMTPTEVSQLLNISERRIRNLIRSNQLPAIKLGRTLRVDRVALEKLIGRKTGADSEDQSSSR